MSKHFAFFENIIMISSTNINYCNLCDKITASAWREYSGNLIKEQIEIDDPLKRAFWRQEATYEHRALSRPHCDRMFTTLSNKIGET